MNYKLDTDEIVCFYEQEFYVLSNFSSFRLNWQGVDFDTSEAAYHWSRFPEAAFVRAAILNARSAHEAYKIAQNHKRYQDPDWDSKKQDVMKNILREKTKQHPYVRKKLLETGDRRLVEDSWRDDYWGWGNNKDGLNILGELWEEIREEYKQNEK